MSDLTVTVNAPVTRIVEIGESVARVVEIGESVANALEIAELKSDLAQSGQYLQSLITVSSAGVATINGASGILTVTGVGGITVTTSGQRVLISGSQNTGSYYPLTGNPSNFSSNGDIVKFTTSLTSGVDNQIISYPSGILVYPQTVVCEMVNDVDNLIYTHAINGVNTSGFRINFSDNLSASGYQLYTTILI